MTKFWKKIGAVVLSLALMASLAVPCFAAEVTTDNGSEVVTRAFAPTGWHHYRNETLYLNVYTDGAAYENCNVTVFAPSSTYPDSQLFQFVATSSGNYIMHTKIDMNYSVERYTPNNNCDIYPWSKNNVADYEIHVAYEPGSQVTERYGIVLAAQVGGSYLAATRTSTAMPAGGYNVIWQATTSVTNPNQLWSIY